jgi:HK97 family phage prohead protease
MATFNIVASEQFTAQETSDGVQVQGLALPFDKVSRNGFTYITESIKEAYKTFEGCPILFNHDSDKVIGHMEQIGVSDEGLTYVMNLDTDGPFGWVANKVKRGDLSKVSIQASYDVDKSYIDDDGVTHAWIDEGFEISVVTIPGFKDTTASVIEAVRQKERTESEQMAKTKENAPEVTPAKDEPEKEVEQLVTEEAKEEEQPVSDIDKRIDDLEAKIEALQTRMEEADKEDEPEKDEEPEAEESDAKPDEEDEEKKVEEAIRKDKITVANESLKKEAPIAVGRRDLIEAVANLR